MDANDLRQLLENTDNKFSIFKDKSTLAKYSFNTSEFITLINDFLIDEEKEQLFEIEYFAKFPSYIKANVINLIKNDSVKLEILERHKEMLQLKDYQIVDVIQGFGNMTKMQILNDKDFIQKNNITKSEIGQIIKSLSDDSKKEVLLDKSLIEETAGLTSYEIYTIVSGLSSEQIKFEMIDLYNFDNGIKLNILKSFSDNTKSQVILENKYDLKDYQLTSCISTLSVEGLVGFLKENREYIDKNNIKIYKIIKQLDKEKQLDFISRFEQIDLSLDEKRKIFV